MMGQIWISSFFSPTTTEQCSGIQGLGGGAYQQASCTWFYQCPACQYMYGVIVVDSLTRPMTDLAVEFKLLDSFVERHAVIPPHDVYTAPFYSIGMK